ncbi:MAG: DegT/DnrJ/EryC1/StrS family aminotransferase [Syntrophales bacterium]
MIPHSRALLNQDDFKGVESVLKSGLLVQGEQVARFEELLSSTVGTGSAAAVNSGTAALHLSLTALGVGKGDEVIIPSFVCSALLNAVRYVGAEAVLADIDLPTFNIDAEDIEKRITSRTKAVIVPHMFGLPADMDAILSLGIPVIEDCAQSIGSRYKRICTGAFGVVSIFSFYATKMLTTGEGGMVLSDNPSITGIIKDLRNYDEKEDYVVRYNYKMTDFQAALGISQLKKLPLFIEKRKRIASLYDDALEGCDIGTPAVPEDRDHVYYRYVISRPPPDFMENMKKAGIDCKRPVFRPLHRYFGLAGYPNTEEAWNRAVSIPIYPALRDQEAHRIADTLRRLCRLK